MTIAKSSRKKTSRQIPLVLGPLLCGSLLIMGTQTQPINPVEP